MWNTIEHIRKEEVLAITKWREDIVNVPQRVPTVMDAGNARQIKQRTKFDKLYNLCYQYPAEFSISPELIAEYLVLISTVIND